MSEKMYDVLVTRVDGSYRLSAYGFTEEEAKQMLWSSIRRNTDQADAYRETWRIQCDVRVSRDQGVAA